MIYRFPPPPFCRFYHFLHDILGGKKVVKSDVQFFFCCLYFFLKKPLPNPESEDLLHMISLKSFIGLILRSSIDFEPVFYVV